MKMRRVLPGLLLLAWFLPPHHAAAAAQLEPAVARRWAQDDAPLADGDVQRSWTWGPAIERHGNEPYAEAPGGERQVWYLDKARMEINDPAADPESDWYVGSGLLVRELVSGKLQVGDTAYETHEPAVVPVAGDINAPITQTITYADLRAQASLDNDQRATPRITSASLVTDTLAPGGATGNAADLARFDVHDATYDDTLGHNVPNVFTKAFNPNDLLFIAGHPLTEPYWVKVPVQQQPQDVLLQAFERRVLTYTPTNPLAWQVEWGNVGQQYAQWRYGQAADGNPLNPNIASKSTAKALRELSATAANIAGSRKGIVGVAVYRLDTDEFYSFQGTRQFEMYSTVKVPIMLTVLDRARRENRRVTTREQNLIEAMIQWSDNNAATTLLNSVGGSAAVEDFLHRNRINDTQINDDAWGASTTTVQDMARLMARLGNCMMLVQRLCTYALQTMQHVDSSQNWGVTAGTGKAAVAVKNGWYPDDKGWGINSVGLVQGEGRNYAIAVYTYPNSSMGYGIDTIEQISAAIYKALQ